MQVPSGTKRFCEVFVLSDLNGSNTIARRYYGEKIPQRRQLRLLGSLILEIPQTPRANAWADRARHSCRRRICSAAFGDFAMAIHVEMIWNN